MNRVVKLLSIVRMENIAGYFPLITNLYWTSFDWSTYEHKYKQFENNMT